MRKVENSAGRSCRRGQLQQRDQAATVVGRGHQVRGLELRLAEEPVRTLGLQRHQRAQDDSGGRGRDAADALELGLPLVGGEVAQQCLEVGEVQQRQTRLVGVVEDQAEAGLLGLVQSEHLAEQQRAEGADGRAQGYAGALPAQRVELDRVAGRRPLLPERGHPRVHPGRGLARGQEAGQVALHVRGEHRHPGVRELLGQQLQGLGLARARSAGHQAVPVEHPQRDPHRGLGVHVVRRAHQGAQLQGRAVEGVPLLHLGHEYLRVGCVAV